MSITTLDTQLQTLLSPLSTRLASSLGLRYLPRHFPTILASAVGFQLIELASGPISRRLFPSTYPHLKKGARKSWDVHAVSLVHSVIIIPLAWAARKQQMPALLADKAFGWDSRIGNVLGFSIGYFLWDSVQSVVTYTNAGFVAHAVACLAIYGGAYRPFLAYYGPSFLLWELSTPFLDIHWFLDKLGKTGSRFQLLNGLTLISTFFAARIVYGGHMSIDFFQTMKSAFEQGKLPLLTYIAYGAGNVLLQGLNWFWFYKMISAIRKRFGGGKADKKSNGHATNGKTA